MSSRACDPARRSDGSQTRNWARRIFLNGENNDARDGMPARTRPCVRISARGAIGAHLYADTCFRSRCAGDAPPIDTVVTAVITAAVTAVTAAAAPTPDAEAAPLRRVLTLCPCAPFGAPAATLGGGFARCFGVLSLGIALGVCRVR